MWSFVFIFLIFLITKQESKNRNFKLALNEKLSNWQASQRGPADYRTIIVVGALGQQLIMKVISRYYSIVFKTKYANHRVLLQCKVAYCVVKSIVWACGITFRLLNKIFLILIEIHHTDS